MALEIELFIDITEKDLCSASEGIDRVRSALEKEFPNALVSVIPVETGDYLTVAINGEKDGFLVPDKVQQIKQLNWD